MSDADPITPANSAGQPVAGRVCGGCTVMGVAELNKAPFQRCPNDCGSCAIYDSRPTTCRSFSCSWLLGLIEGDERRRPDKLGLVFNPDQVAGKPITFAHEVWAGAAKQAAGEVLLREMSQLAPVVSVEHQSNKCEVITPDPQLRQLIRQLLHDEWYKNLYGQVVVNNFSA